MRFHTVWIVLVSAVIYLGLQVYYPAWTILFLVLLATIASVHKRKRAKALQGVAPSLGFSYQRNGSLEDIDVFSLNFHLFSTGDSKSIRNVLAGQRNGIDIRVFEYPTNRSILLYRQYATVLLCQSHTLDLPPFELRPKGMLHKLGNWLRPQGIQGDPHPDFSARYVLQGEDTKALRALFTPAMVRYFANKQDLCVVGWSHTLLVYREGHCVSPHRLAAFLEEGLRMYALFTAP